jgi:hypothetical protein
MVASTKILLLVSVIVILSILSCSRALGNGRDSFNAQSDEILYFQSTPSYLGYLMNTSTPTGQGMSLQVFSYVYFISPPLAQRFTFQTIGIVMFYEEILQRGTYTLNVTFGFFDVDGTPHDVASNSSSLYIGSTSIALNVSFNTLVLEQERLFAKVGASNSLMLSLRVYWGNSSDYPSRIDYNGTAVFAPEVPEFQSFLILPIFMIATLLTVIVYRRKHLERNLESWRSNEI